MSNVRDAKPRIKTITFKDGVAREIRFTLNAMAEIEEKYGSVDEGFKKLDEGSIKATRFILWAGLIHTEENLTEQQVGNLIDMEILGDIMRQLGDGLTEDMPVVEDNGAGQLPNE